MAAEIAAVKGDEFILEMVPGVQFCNSTIANEGSVLKINAIN